MFCYNNCCREGCHGSGHRCLRCLLRAGKPFFVGRTGLGKETWAACLAHHNDSIVDKERRAWWAMLGELVMENGIYARDQNDAIEYGPAARDRPSDSPAISAVMFARAAQVVPTLATIGACARAHSDPLVPTPDR